VEKPRGFKESQREGSLKQKESFKALEKDYEKLGPLGMKLKSQPLKHKHSK